MQINRAPERGHLCRPQLVALARFQPPERDRPEAEPEQPDHLVPRERLPAAPDLAVSPLDDGQVDAARVAADERRGRRGLGDRQPVGALAVAEPQPAGPQRGKVGVGRRALQPAPVPLLDMRFRRDKLSTPAAWNARHQAR